MQKVTGLLKRDGYWCYRFMVAGRQYSGTTGLADTERNKKAAGQFLDERRREVRMAGVDMHSEKLDFATAAGFFLLYCKDVKYRAKQSSYIRLRSSFGSLVAFFGAAAVAAIDPGMIDNYKHWRIADHGVKDVTLRHDLHALSLFFQHGMKQRWCTANRVREVEIPSDKEAVRNNVLTPQQEEKYFRVAKTMVDKAGRPNLYDLGRLMLNQGCRPEEITQARKDAFDLIEKTLQINKGKTRAARREIYLTEESCQILQSRMGSPGDYLFPSQRYPDRPLIKLSKTHDIACERAGVSFIIYDLRHTFGTRMAPLVDPITLAAIMGHANLRTIMRYVHPQSEEKRAAMERYQAAMKRGQLRVVNG